MIIRHDIIILELHEMNMHPIRIPGFKIQWLHYDNIDFTILQICNIRFHAPIPDPGRSLSVMDHSRKTSGGDHRLSSVIVAVWAGKLSSLCQQNGKCIAFVIIHLFIIIFMDQTDDL